MRPLCGVLLLLILTCQLATSTPIFDRDDAGSHRRHRSAGVGDTIRDWFNIMKDKIVGKWHEWFGDETPTLNISPQDILNIDKTLEKRIQGYPGIFTDLSNVTFDPKQDWGVHLGNWYVIRKLAGEKYGPDCDTDEWDFKSWLPTFPNFDWPNGFGKPKPPTTVPPTEPEPTTVQSATTLRPFDEEGTTATQTERSVPTTASTTEVTTAASPEATVTSSEGVPTSNEFTVTNSESTVATTEPILISAEPTTTASIATTDESESSATTSTESISTSTESTVIASESTMTPVSEEVTESPTTPFDLTLPVYNSKREEDNETIERSTQRPRNRPSSAEVIMF